MAAPGLGAEDDEESKSTEFVAAEDSDASLTDDESLASALTLLRPPSGGAAPADAPAVPQEHVAAAMDRLARRTTQGPEPYRRCGLVLTRPEQHTVLLTPPMLALLSAGA